MDKDKDKDDRKTVLLVEDEAIIALSESLILEKHGFKVVVASSGEKAVKLVEDGSQFDLVLMDVNLGSGMDGTEAAKLILEKHDLPLVFHSSHTEREVVEKTEGITSYGYIVKNSGETVLIVSIKMAFRLFEAKVREREKEETLKKSEDRLRSILDNLQDSYFQTGLTGRFTMVSPSAARTYGYESAEEMVGLEAESLYDDPGDRAALMETLRSAGRAVDFVCRGRKTDGTLLWVSMNAQLRRARDGTVLGTEGVVRDITDRKLAEDSYRESEERFRSIAEYSPVGIYRTDSKGDCLYVNRLWSEMSGLSSDEAAGQGWLRGLHPDDREKIGENWYRSVQSGGRWGYEYRFISPEGRITWVYGTAAALYDQDGGVKGYIGSNIDITDRKKAERELEETQEKYRQLFETMAQGVVYQAADGTIVSANPAAERILGLTLDQMRGKTSLDTSWRSVRADGTDLPGEDHPAMIALRTGKPVGPVIMGVHNPAKKTHAWLTVTAIPVFSPGETVPRQAYAVFSDITDRKLAEDALLQTQSLLEEMSKMAKIGAWKTEVETRRIEWTEEMYSIYEMDSSTSMSIEKLMDYYTPASRKLHEEGIRRTMETGEPFDLELEITTPRGTRKWLHSMGKAVYDGGRITHRMGITQDITKRKQIEEEVNKLFKEKELILKEVHHRVKNNMNTMIALLRLQANSRRNHETAEILLESAGRLESMKVLYDKLYRSEDVRKLSIKDYLPSLITEISAIFSMPVRIETQIEDIILELRVLSPLGIIVNELITNSLKYAFKEEDGKLRDGGVISVSARKVGSLVTIDYRDNGVGMPESVGLESSGGFGLQLIVLLVRQIGGTIRLERTEGTRYVIEFDG